jgi:hypothetical protein
MPRMRRFCRRGLWRFDGCSHGQSSVRTEDVVVSFVREREGDQIVKEGLVGVAGVRTIHTSHYNIFSSS